MSKFNNNELDSFSLPPRQDRIWSPHSEVSLHGGKAVGAWSYISSPQYVFIA